MRNHDHVVIIASLDPPTIWNLYESHAEAEEDLDNANSAGLQGDDATFEIMEYSTYRAAHRAYYAED